MQRLLQHNSGGVRSARNELVRQQLLARRTAPRVLRASLSLSRSPALKVRCSTFPEAALRRRGRRRRLPYGCFAGYLPSSDACRDTGGISTENMMSVSVRCSMRTLTRQQVTKLWNASDQHCRSDSAGGGSRLIMKMTRMGCTDHRGGCSSAISTALRPRSPELRRIVRHRWKAKGRSSGLEGCWGDQSEALQPEFAPDAERPHVHLAVVAALLDHLRRHPVRCADECVAFGHGRCQLRRHAEVCGRRQRIREGEPRKNAPPRFSYALPAPRHHRHDDHEVAAQLIVEPYRSHPHDRRRRE